MFATFGAVWWAGWQWYPFATVHEDRSSASLFEGAPPHVMGPLFLVLGVVGVASGFVMLQEHVGPALRRAATGYGAGAAVLFAGVMSDYTPLTTLVMWPAMLVFAFTGVPGAQDGIGDILYWHRVNVLLIFVGGLLWAGATLGHYRRTQGACSRCGRGGLRPEPTTERLLRWGRAGVWVAVLSTVPYDITRLAWFLGWPLGLSDPLYDSLAATPGLLAIGLVLGLVSTGGAMLTHGLIAAWGERFPSWVPRLARRRVPVMLAVIPAATVTVTIPAASVMFLNPRVNDGFSAENWSTWAPSLIWLFWAVGLGVATYCYWLRRRGPCQHCERTDGRTCDDLPDRQGRIR
ncbi:NYN domain-containing protein [Nocardioides sp. zg-1228]|uniref:NYN domain-containing protein n=1 Tax=Nocardioides sp. zg-1228 TaxID=2763008 RepID=UPI0016423AF9|nr:NYN domain-containing protein [Nocardioides sp. zg-1228]MBC2934694.1 NYN domain-containing protein [Nocardioides sp. zg-1228]QSF56012.1 NYN domain-containing protein [Nocardioides sp. zg-1228]